MSSFATITAGPDYEDRHEIHTGPIPVPVWMTGLWIALFIIRPWEELIPELATIRFERVYVLTVLGVVLGSGLYRFCGCMQTYAVLLFLSVLAVSSLFAYDGSLAWIQFYIYLTYIVFYFVLLSVIRTPHQLQFIIACYIVTMAIYLGKSEWEYFIHGRHQWVMDVPRLIGIESTFGSPNSVASSTVLSLPFLQFLWWHRQKMTRSWAGFVRRWFPRFLVAYFILAMTAIMLTYSRSGAVGFLVFLVLFGKTRPESGSRVKRILGVLLAIVVLWTFMPEASKGRISTLWSPEAGPANAKASADGRKESFFAGLDMFSREPVTGVGLGNTALYREKFIDGKSVSPHNFYGEVLGETGTIGAAGFVLLIACLFANIRATNAIAERCLHPSIEMLSDLARTCGHVIVLLLVSGMAGAGMLRFQWLWLAAFALLARNLSESIARDESERLDLADDNLEPWVVAP